MGKQRDRQGELLLDQPRTQDNALLLLSRMIDPISFGGQSDSNGTWRHGMTIPHEKNRVVECTGLLEPY